MRQRATRIWMMVAALTATMTARATTGINRQNDVCPLVKIEAERLPDMSIPRAGHNVFYANGELTVVGGHTSGFVLTPTAEYFSNGQWHIMPTVYLHDNAMSVVLEGGRKALIAGGHEKNLGIGQSFEVEMYDRAMHSFEGFGCLDKKRAFAQGLELDSGRVMIVGNHNDNDAIELFDRRKFFTHAKDVAIWRSSPYVLRTAPDDAIIFGAVWRNNHFEPCDTVDRLHGEPITEPLLHEWMPMLYDQGNHAANSRIGDYAYILAAYNMEGEIAFIRVTGEKFTLLPTTCPIPTSSQWGTITYNRPAIADREAHRVYLVGNDSTSRAYVLRVDYDQTPAPLTLYYTDPLPDFGDTSPVLTPDGDLIITGGITDDNFAPFASVWLLHLSTQAAVSHSSLVTSHSSSPLRWWLCLVAVAGIIGLALFIFLHRRRRHQPMPTTEPLPLALDDEALMQRIRQLLEDEQLYLDSELKLSDIADRLNSNRSYISMCINSQEGCSFSGLLNRYRVAYAQQLMRQQPDMKLSNIATESGFSSEQSFYRAFKTATGLTPREWVQKNFA